MNRTFKRIVTAIAAATISLSVALPAAAFDPYHHDDGKAAAFLFGMATGLALSNHGHRQYAPSHLKRVITNRGNYVFELPRGSSCSDYGMVTIQYYRLGSDWLRSGCIR